MVNQSGFGNVLLIGFLGILVLIIAGYFGSTFFIQSNSATIPTANIAAPSVTPVPSPAEKTQEVLMQDDYSFTITIPEGYEYQNRTEGDLLGEVISLDKSKSVLFYKSTGGGVRGRITPYIIDGIQLDLEYGQTPSCFSHLDSSKVRTHEGAFTHSLIFGMSLRCEEGVTPEPAEFEKIINTIKFSPELKKVLTGEELAPLLKSSPYTLEELQKTEEDYEASLGI